jgi:hypothetical protein
VPKIRLLDIRNAEVLLTFASKPGQVKLTGSNLRIRDLSPRTGGTIDFDSAFDVALREPTLDAAGKITGTFQLTDVDPAPHGKGTIELTAESGSYAAGDGRLSLTGLRLAADMQYDRRGETFAITRLQGASRELGTIEGSGEAVLRGDTPWSARLSTARIDFDQAFRVLKPFLPADYRTWMMQGKGALETELKGTYQHDRPSFNGQVTFSFTEGGFSSADGTTAAQGMTGKLILKLQYAPAEDKLAFQVQSDAGDGEYLWGTYYKSFAGQRASLVSEGAVYLDAGLRYETTGSLDLFQTGEYRFQGAGDVAGSTLRLTLADLSHAKILQRLFADYLKDASPGLASLSLTGTSALDATIRRGESGVAVTGEYRMDGTTLNAPGMSLAVQDVAMHIPFDLVYPVPPETAPSTPPGQITIRAVRREPVALDDLRIPLSVAHNAVEVPDAVSIPLFGGAIHLYGLRLDDLLVPTRYHFGIRIEGLDLGRLTQRLTGTELPGVINADLGYMTYEAGRVASEGRAVIGIFGGQIEMNGFFAENVASPARRIGGDITFRDINLEEVTKRIAVGRMTGIIQGSLKHFVMEYGQPARFDLEVESVPTRGVPQRISMDAIQSISILGTGADSALNQGITRLFREYPYSRIGLRCVLINDQFTVRGTIHAGGKEYLVRRGFLRGVDVVNQNPDNVISFRDMEERLQRITRPVEIRPGGSRFSKPLFTTKRTKPTKTTKALGLNPSCSSCPSW